MSHCLASLLLLALPFAARADTFEYSYVTPGPGVVYSDPVGFDVFTNGPATFNQILPSVECHYEPYGRCDGIYIDREPVNNPFNPGDPKFSYTIAYVFDGGLDYEGALYFLNADDFTVGDHPLYMDGGTFSVRDTSATPEPSSFALLGTGLLGIAGVLRKRLC